jgi:hypothetical protein
MNGKRRRSILVIKGIHVDDGCNGHLKAHNEILSSDVRAQRGRWKPTCSVAVRVFFVYSDPDGTGITFVSTKTAKMRP